jgi:hypothetical protein
MWRFGCLTFTADNDGLVFWGGSSSYYGSFVGSTSYYYPHLLTGSFYACNLASAGPATTGVTVTSILRTGEGGATAASSSYPSYTPSSPYSPSMPSGAFSTVNGVIKPVAGFVSKNRHFMYVVTCGAISSSESTGNRLIGVNIRSVDTAQAINGKTDFRAFAVGGASGWPARRSFIPEYGYYGGYYGIQYSYLLGGHHGAGAGTQVMANNGTVYFVSNYQTNGPVSQTSSTYGGPIHATYYSYGYGQGSEVFAFAADVGGTPVQVTSFNNNSGYRIIHYLEASKSGEDVAMVYCGTYYYTHMYSSEYMHFSRGVKLSPSGTLLSPVRNVAMEGGAGRASGSMSFFSFGDRVYYGYLAGASNENAKQLVEASYNVTTNSWTYRRANPGRWYEVLHAGR